MKTNNKVLFMTQAAMIAAIYVVLCLVFEPISYGAIQTRVAEALTVLPFFTPAAIPGLFIGCLIANALGGGILLDVLAGSLTTLAAAYLDASRKEQISGKCSTGGSERHCYSVGAEIRIWRTPSDSVPDGDGRSWRDSDGKYYGNCTAVCTGTV